MQSDYLLKFQLYDQQYRFLVDKVFSDGYIMRKVGGIRSIKSIAIHLKGDLED